MSANHGVGWSSIFGITLLSIANVFAAIHLQCNIMS